MDAIVVTLDALRIFAQDHKLQSAEFDEGRMLCDVISSKNENEWCHGQIRRLNNKKTVYFYTKNIDTKNILVLDRRFLEPLVKRHYSEIMMIFQNLVKYSIRRFDNEPLVWRERKISDFLYMVYPLPFQAKRDSVKTMVYETITESSHCYTVYYCGTGDNSRLEYKETTTKIVLSDLEKIKFDLSDSIDTPESCLSVTQLSSVDVSPDSISLEQNMGLERWNLRLTNPQKEFVSASQIGAERLEGAAGTGKTISLVLRCIYLLSEKINNDEEYHIIFFTHSKAALEHVHKIFENNFELFSLCLETQQEKPKCSICITTLQDWCSWQLLGINHIEETEFIDKDASYAKGIQCEYIREAYDLVKAQFSSFIPVMCSTEFQDFLSHSLTDSMLLMLQHEIAVVIKGKTRGVIEKYKSLPYPKNGLPIKNESDRSVMFAVYDAYQEALKKACKYDTDDIVMSAYGNVSTPIIDRRREISGYDLCVIDETQLFNLNELSIFHYTNKPTLKNRIIYAIDRSQAIGEWEMSNEELNVFSPAEGNHVLNTMFRSSPEIVRLAFGILSNGASLFENFENPMSLISANLTPNEERKCTVPAYYLCANDNLMIEYAFQQIEQYKRDHKVKASSILLAVSTEELMTKLEKFVAEKHKSVEFLQSRADSVTLYKANQGGKYVCGLIDYVGGLEFDAVVLIGIDKDRVPPQENETSEAQHYMNYMWHNRMYVAITRAKYSVTLYGSCERGESPMLTGILDAQLL